MTRAEHALLTRRIAQAVHQAAIEAIDAVLSHEAVPGWPGAWAGSLRVTPLLTDREQARRICARLEALCRS